MPPKKPSSIPLGDIVEIVTETRQTRRGLRTTEKEVLVHSSKDKKSGQPSRSKSQARRNMAIKPGHTSRRISSDDEETVPLRPTNVQEDILEGQGDDGEDVIDDRGVGEEQAAMQETLGQGNVCSRWPPPFLDLIVCRHQWTNGYMFAGDISISYLRWRASRRPQAVHYAKKPWLSSVVIVLEATTSVLHAAFKHTSGHHSIGYLAGLVLTSPQYLCIHWGLSYVLSMMVNHVL
jgi:hypothetical protein